MTPEATDLFYAIHHCRAMRRLKPDPVPENLLMKLISAANQGPTGSNKQNRCQQTAPTMDWRDMNRTVHRGSHKGSQSGGTDEFSSLQYKCPGQRRQTFRPPGPLHLAQSLQGSPRGFRGLAGGSAKTQARGVIFTDSTELALPAAVRDTDHAVDSCGRCCCSAM